MIQPSYRRTRPRKVRGRYSKVQLRGTRANHTYDPTPIGLIDRFMRELRKWRSETKFTSSIDDVLAHEAYRKIVGMGDAVVELLLDELRTRPGFEVYALEDILGNAPYTEEVNGDIKAMSDAWVANRT